MKSVLVIEDDLAIAAMLRDALDEYSVSVVERPGDVPEDATPALVITDLQSPDGYRSDSALRIVQELRVRTGAPVVVLTAHRAAEADAALTVEADAVMLKPFDLGELLVMVDRLAV